MSDIDAKLGEADRIPLGIICMWAGDAEHLPKGWKLCDGKDEGIIKVPDLRSRFIVGAGDADKPNTSGQRKHKRFTNTNWRKTQT